MMVVRVLSSTFSFSLQCDEADHSLAGNRDISVIPKPHSAAEPHDGLKFQGGHATFDP